MKLYIAYFMYACLPFLLLYKFYLNKKLRVSRRVNFFKTLLEWHGYVRRHGQDSLSKRKRMVISNIVVILIWLFLVLGFYFMVFSVTQKEIFAAPKTSQIVP